MPEPCPFDDCDGVLDRLPSIHMSMCCQCCAYFDWKLKEGQKSVMLHNYVKGRDDEIYKAMMGIKDEKKAT